MKLIVARVFSDLFSRKSCQIEEFSIFMATHLLCHYDSLPIIRDVISEWTQSHFHVPKNFNEKYQHAHMKQLKWRKACSRKFMVTDCTNFQDTEMNMRYLGKTEIRSVCIQTWYTHLNRWWYLEDFSCGGSQCYMSYLYDTWPFIFYGKVNIVDFKMSIYTSCEWHFIFIWFMRN